MTVPERRLAAVRLAVRLTPRAGLDRLDGVGPAGELLARVRAPAVDGAANEALRRLLAAALELAPSALTLEAGATARAKRFRVEGVSAAALLARWPGLALTEVARGRR